jgi:hypothetical protein
MVNRPLMWAAGNPRLQRLVADSRMAANTVHRFVAGNQLEDAVQVAQHSTSGGSAGFSTCSARG